MPAHTFLEKCSSNNLYFSCFEKNRFRAVLYGNILENDVYEAIARIKSILE
jgi:hypothetical protein